MYNGHVIKDLLEKQKKSNKSLLAYIGKDVNGGNSYLRSLLNGNPTVRTLEPIADFFDVPMDVFFIRGKNYSGLQTSVVGNGNAVGNCNQVAVSDRKQIELLERLIEDKDKRIETLEALVKLLQEKQ